MSTYDVAFYKFLNHPGELTPGDMCALKARDPWVAKRAVVAWRQAQSEIWETVQGKAQGKVPRKHVVVRIKK